MNAAVLVDGRGAPRKVTALEMYCDAHEIAYPSDGSKATGSWIAGSCLFSGTAYRGGESDTLGELAASNAQGSASLAVVSDRVLGIVSPHTPAEPAIWFAAAVSSLRVEASGSKGFIKKRPSTIVLSGDGWTVNLSQVGRHFRSSNQLQPGQEGALLTALGG